MANYTLKKFLQNLVFFEKGGVSFSYEVLVRLYPNSYTGYLNLLLEGFGWAGFQTIPDAMKNRYCKDSLLVKRPYSICLRCEN